MLISMDLPPMRFCPGCDQKIPEDPKYWSTARIVQANGDIVSRPSGYCRKCENEKRVQRRRDRRAGIPPKRGICSCCGQYSQLVHINPETDDLAGVLIGSLSFCQACVEHMQWCDWDVKQARAEMKKWGEHNAEEAALDAKWRANRRRTPHLGVKNPPASTHVFCEREGKIWPKIVLFLSMQVLERAKKQSEEVRRAQRADAVREAGIWEVMYPEGLQGAMGVRNGPRALSRIINRPRTK